MYNWATFLIGFVTVWILYVINKIRVKNLYTFLNFFWHDKFVRGDNFEIIIFK